CLGEAAAAGPAKHRPEGFARKVPSCGVARLVEQNERSTFVARLASEHFSCKRGSQRVLHQPARLRKDAQFTSERFNHLVKARRKMAQLIFLALLAFSCAVSPAWAQRTYQDLPIVS